VTLTATALVWATTRPTVPAPESVSPGLWGFLVVFVLAIVVWLLMRNMTRRLRRLRFREQERLRREGGDGGAREPGNGEPPSGPGGDHP
jgi:flagellar biosynthesis/type III secretory pathway M-ring protein FliF/YscJ